MITPAGSFEIPANRYPPPFWQMDEEPIDAPDDGGLPDEKPNPNPDENRPLPVYSCVH